MVKTWFAQANSENTLKYMPLFSLFKMLVVVIFLSFNGMIFYYAIENRLLRSSNQLSETQLFTHALFFSWIINGIIGQFLALFKLFSSISFLVLFCIGVIVFYKEAIFIIKYVMVIPIKVIKLITNDPIFCISLIIFTLLLLIQLLNVQVPATEYVDIWLFHIPIADSIANQSGFNFPIINNLFYGSMPSFAEVLFAEGLLFSNSQNIINLINYIIFISFLLLLFSFAKYSKPYALLLLSWILVNPHFYYSVTGMPDTTRACFDVVAILFILFYFNEKATYYLIFSAISCGAGLASKYLGLFILILIFFIFLVNFKYNKHFLKTAGLYLIGVLIVCGVWYGKNLIIYKNPIYPFIFGHPGISNEWMAFLAEELGKAFAPQDRVYSREILSLAGWRDCYNACYNIFFYYCPFSLICIMIIAALLFIRHKIMLLVPISIAYFIFWHFIIFATARYGISGFLMFITSFYFSAIYLFDRVTKPFRLNTLVARYQYFKKIPYGIILSFIVFLLSFKMLNMNLVIKNFYKNNKEIILSYYSNTIFENYMTKKFPYYELYKFIAKNNFTNVFNPFDINSINYMKYVIPGKKPDDTFIPAYKLCNSLDDLDNFLSDNNIKYFVVINLPPVALDHLEKNYVDMTLKIFSELIPRSELIYSDEMGDKLYMIKRK